jgi:hypothetical protein
VTLVVLRPVDSTHFAVIGTDTKSLPSTLPASQIASFTLASPIAVKTGDTFGIFGGTGITCDFNGGAIPSTDGLQGLGEPTVPTVGTTLTAGSSTPSPKFMVDIVATFESSDDLAVSTTTSPSAPTTGNLAVLASTINNAGSTPGAGTFTDHVPAGLAIGSASAGDGACSVSGQTVTCAISGLPAGHTAPVNIVVTPSAPGAYTNNVTLAATGLVDPNSANNSASATLHVGARPVAPRCSVPKLAGTPGSVAKQVLILLGCKVKVTHVRSRNVASGRVVGTQPGPGTYAFGKQVTLKLSSGPPKRRHPARRR